MILDRYLVKQFVPVFLVASMMFVMLLCLIDLFLNLVHYLTYEATFSQIMKVSIYYIPKSFSYALPISLLFAVAYLLGDLYARNELTSIIASGVPFWKLSRSLLVIGALASIFAFFFEDSLVIPTLKIKNELGSTLRHLPHTKENTNIVIKTNNDNRIYSVDYFDYPKLTLNGVNIIERDGNGSFISRIHAPLAKWTGAYWQFENAVIYQWEDQILRIRTLTSTEEYDEDPEIFRRNAVQPSELNAKDVGNLARDLKQFYGKSSEEYLKSLSDYYHRFSFSSVSFIVVILSISMGGRFRKNIMLMSLLTSLSVAVVFYVMEMISMMMAGFGLIPPIIGAWFPVFFFTGVGVLLVRYSKT